MSLGIISGNRVYLTGVGKGGDYKQSLKQKAADRQEKKKAQIKQEKESGVHEAKQAARGKVADQLRKHREGFVRLVAEHAGWDKKDLEFDEEKHADLSDSAKKKARRDHTAGLMKRARKEVEINRQALLLDHEKLSSVELSLDDLNPMPETAPSLGFSTNYAQRAEDHGLTDPIKQDQKAAFSGSPSQKIANSAKEELSKFNAENPDTQPADPTILKDAQKAASMVRAMKKLKMAEKLASDTKKEINNAPLVESKSYVLDVSEADLDSAVKKQIADDVRTVGAVGLLSEVDAAGGEHALGGHVASGAFNALNAFSVAAASDSLIDRSVVDVLGINGASQVLARQILKTHEAGDLDRVRLAVENHHAETQGDRQAGAVKQARSLMKSAEAIELPDGVSGDDLAHAQLLNKKRRDTIHEAKRVLGNATGELQANAALVLSLREGVTDKGLELSLGGQSMDSAITQLHALGLEKGDYSLDKAGGHLVVTISGGGMDRLAKPVDMEGMARVKRNMEIISGKQDEAGWLPKGFADRPDLSMTVEPGVAESLAEPFSPGKYDTTQDAIRAYIGGRAADGDPVSDILSDLMSHDFSQKAGGSANEYHSALEEVVPLRGKDGEMRPVESHSELFGVLADQFVGAKYGGDRAPLHSQSFHLDQKSVDALHRSLAATPEGVAAFKPVGELSPQERGGLRKWFSANIASGSGGGDEAAALSAHDGQEPEKLSEDLFGEESVSPEWKEWSQKRGELRSAHDAASLNWGKYVDTMGSPESAISSVQDLVRSRVLHDFSQQHNRLNPDSPIKLGRVVIRGNLNHLDAVNPEARLNRQQERKQMVDSLRERIDGKYSSGSVKDKIEGFQQSKSAFEQSQMGLFSSEVIDDPKPGSDLSADERYTSGHAAEQKVAGMMSVVGQNFKPGEPTKLWSASMSGKYAPQQRAIKMLDANKRIALGYGAGSGKTAVYLGGFSHLHEQGKVKRALMLVPSAVQSQFSGEALRYLEPGKYNLHIQPGASQKDRIAAYKNPDHHVAVMTHEAFVNAGAIARTFTASRPFTINKPAAQ